MATTREMFRMCEPALTTEQLQKLYRLLHEVLLAAGRSEEAGQVMVELLGTFTMENASQAREEAQRCIVASLADPNTFLFDHLLSLKPVKCLAGEPIHNLLNIFVSEKLDAYIKFYESNKSFVEGLGLKHEENLRKMKLLSFMQLAENRSVSIALSRLILNMTNILGVKSRLRRFRPVSRSRRRRWRSS